MIESTEPVAAANETAQPAEAGGETPKEEQKKVAKAAKKKPERSGGKKPQKSQKPKPPIKAAEPSKSGEILTVDLADLVQYDNPRHEPANLYEMGFTLIGDPSVNEADEETGARVSLLHMALSDDPEQYGHYVSLIEEHETVDRDEHPAAPQSILELAQDIKRFSQLYPILVRNHQGHQGKYIVMDGGRRIAAVLYLHAKSKVEGAKGAKVWAATVEATTRACKPQEAFLISLVANLSRKGFTPVQEGRVYHEMLQTVNPTSGKKWTMKEAAAYVGVGYSTFRNREALWKPKDPDTGKGLSDADRAKVEAGEMLLTAASRKALGEKHYSDTGKPSRSRNKGIPLAEMQRLFDETAENNLERLQAIADCMGLTLKEAKKESEKRIAAADEREVRGKRKAG